MTKVDKGEALAAKLLKPTHHVQSRVKGANPMILMRRHNPLLLVDYKIDPETLPNPVESPESLPLLPEQDLQLKLGSIYDRTQDIKGILWDVLVPQLQGLDIAMEEVKHESQDLGDVNLSIIKKPLTDLLVAHTLRLSVEQLGLQVTPEQLNEILLERLHKGKHAETPRIIDP